MYLPTVLRIPVCFSYIIYGRWYESGHVLTLHSQNVSVEKGLWRSAGPTASFHSWGKRGEGKLRKEGRLEVMCLWPTSRFVTQTRLESSSLFSLSGELPWGLRRACHQSWPPIIQRHTQRSHLEGTWDLLGRLKQSESLQIQDEQSYVQIWKLQVARNCSQHLHKWDPKCLASCISNRASEPQMKQCGMTFVLMVEGWMCPYFT